MATTEVRSRVRRARRVIVTLYPGAAGVVVLRQNYRRAPNAHRHPTHLRPTQLGPECMALALAKIQGRSGEVVGGMFVAEARGGR